jgi:phosphatidate cytidylyltransferase
VRTYTTFLMLGGFVMLLLLGHLPLVGLLVACQVAMFKEVKRLSKVLSTQTDLQSFRPLHWTWFFTAMFFSYGRVLASYFHWHIPYHSFISFALYMTGVVMFVLSLETGYYKYQFEMFAWVQLTLFLIVVQSTVIVVNMFSGLIWFILPALLIISNDTWAYIFGFFFGRTPLISLSPKKTWSVAEVHTRRLRLTFLLCSNAARFLFTLMIFHTMHRSSETNV